MPLYEYKCSKCHQVFEVMQKFSDEPLKVHEGCGGDVTKLLSTPSFQFKGSGWYITDYAKSHSSPAHNGKSENGTSASGSSESSSSSSDSSSSKKESSSGTTAAAPAAKSDK